MKKVLMSNDLKVIAFIAMVLDHIGYFFVEYISTEMYCALRIIGRIAMPLFVFLLVEGIIHTKDIKKYLTRLLGVAIVTQVVIILMNVINVKIFSEVIELNKFLNIVFSFCLTTILIIINNNKYFKHNEKTVLRFVITLAICITYVFIPMDYGFIVPVMGIGMYIISNIKNKNIYMFILAILLFVPLYFKSFLGAFTIFALPVILLYNGKKRKTKLDKYFYYIAFPMQYILIYFIFVTKTLLLS